MDVDDTLYLERDYVHSGLRAVGETVSRLGVPGFREVADELFEAGTRGNIFDEALRRLDAGHLLPNVPRLVEIYRQHQPMITLLPDALSALEQAHQSGRVAAITDGPAESQRRKVDALGLRRWAAPVVITDAFGPGYGKPHPRGFQAIEAAAPGMSLAYIADNPAKDFSEPARRGWLTVRVRRPNGLHERAESGADVQAEVSDLANIHRLLDSLEVASPTGRANG